jgi:GT2 family glycosyltransferase
MYYEDTDICRRIRNDGGDICYFTDFGIIHNHGGSSRINIKTAGLTKTEVIISRHVYISKHSGGLTRLLLQSFTVISNIIMGLITALPGFILFFKPRMLLRSVIFGRLVSYYYGALLAGKWISRRSVNFRRKI